MTVLLVIIFFLGIIEMITQIVRLINGAIYMYIGKEIPGADKNLYKLPFKHWVIFFQMLTVISLIILYWLLFSNFPWATYF